MYKDLIHQSTLILRELVFKNIEFCDTLFQQPLNKL